MQQMKEENYRFAEDIEIAKLGVEIGAFGTEINSNIKAGFKEFGTKLDKANKKLVSTTRGMMNEMIMQQREENNIFLRFAIGIFPKKNLMRKKKINNSCVLMILMINLIYFIIINYI